MIDIGNENGTSFTADEVRSYLREMDAEDEFDDIELDEVILAAVSGGGACGSVPGSGQVARERHNAAITAKLNAEDDVGIAQRSVREAQDALSAGTTAAQKRINESLTDGGNFM